MKSVCLFLLLYLFFGTCPGLAQQFGTRKRSELLQELSTARQDSTRLSILFELSKAYLSVNQTDSGLIFVNAALPLSQRLGDSVTFHRLQFYACRLYCLDDDLPAAEVLAKNARGLLKMQMLQEMSEHYSLRPGNLPENLDSAWPYIQRAVTYTDSLGKPEAIQNTRAVVGKYYYQRGQLQKGIEYFQQNTKDCQLAKDKKQEAHWWSEMATYMPCTDESMPLIINANIKARELFAAVGDSSGYYHIQIDLAEDHWTLGQFRLAEKEQSEANQGLIRLGQKKMFNNYRKLAVLELYLGNHNQALQWILKGKKNMDSLHVDYGAAQLDETLASIYWARDDIERALYWYKTALDEVQGRTDHFIYGIIIRIVGALIRKGDIPAAETTLAQFEKEHPPVRSRDKEYLATVWGDLYFAKHDIARAEKAYLEMIRFDRQAEEENKREMELWVDLARPEANYRMGKFYVETGQFARAQPYLQEVLKPSLLLAPPLNTLRDTYLLLYRVDSAGGRLASAINQRLMYERYADSISTAAKDRQLEELEVQYDSQTKDTNIVLLNQLSRLQRKDISRASLVRNIILGCLALTLVVILLLYKQYRSKQKSNRMLEQLVTEKEWLLKEVHHRVKNNLQTVVALLGSQALQLTDESLDAIRSSQNRVLSISLIHQRLYQSSDLTSVSMPAYLPELIDHLKNIYDIHNQILFQTDIEPVNIFIGQAVSIGLILNEAITNAIKYAFPEKQKGATISIRMIKEDNGIVHLTVRDNGIGISGLSLASSTGSLGLRLMQGLSEDLAATFSIYADNGTTVSIRFVANASHEDARKIMAQSKTPVNV